MDIQNLITYCNSRADEFKARLNRIRSFVPNHNLTSGTANEMILRNFLSELSPGRYNVGQGFICDPTRSDKVSKQCDIIVYDQIDFPLVHSEGEIKIVWPNSVKIIIEVKTKLDKKSLYKAINNISSARKLDPNNRLSNNDPFNQMIGVIFAFNSIRAKSLIKHLVEYPEVIEINNAPHIIFLFNSNTIILPSDPWETKKTYEVIKIQDNGVIITYLLLIFLYKTSSKITSHIHNLFKTLRDELLVTNIQLISSGLKIGK